MVRAFCFLVVALVALGSSADAAGLRCYRAPTVSRSGATRSSAAPRFPNTTTRTITTGKLHYINPAAPKSR